jgi:hypothetical protein
MKKKLLFGALLLAAVASVVAHLYVQAQVYYPVVRLVLPDGLSLTAVLPQTKERRACGAANERFVAPFKEACRECKVAAARCERELEGLELAMHEGAPLPYPLVVARNARIALIGPPEAAQLGCEVAARQILAKGFRFAACIPAKLLPARS